MIFYGNGIVWDADKDQKLCLFVDGQLDTEDEYVIERLLKYGFDHDEKQEKKVKTSKKEA